MVMMCSMPLRDLQHTGVGVDSPLVAMHHHHHHVCRSALSSC
jgi:hypothetical protein